MPLFCTGKPSLSGIMGVDGTGRLAAGVVATADWIIIPLNCSAASGKTLFYVGCKMTYQVAGGDFLQELSPNYMTVVPVENVTLRLFYDSNLSRSKLFSVPQTNSLSTVAAMVTNYGTGLCHNLTLINFHLNVTSGGGSVPFKVAYTRLGGENVLSSLSIGIGEMSPKTSSTIEWDIAANTSAVIKGFNLTFANSDLYGNTYVTNITQVDHHHLFHRVSILADGGSPIPAFLVDDDHDNIPERLFDGFRSRAVHDVAQWFVEDVNFDRNEHKGTKRYSFIRVDVRVPKSGWGYVKVDSNVVAQVLLGNALLTASCKTLTRELPNTNLWSTSYIERKNLAHFTDYHDTSFHGNVQYELVFGPMNSHFPRFEDMSSVFYVAEGFREGEVLVVKATDEDGDSITYTFDQPKDFTLDQATGALQRQKPFLIGEKFQMVVMATDDGIPPKSSRLPFTVIVTKDGNPPPTTTPQVVSPDFTPQPDGENVTFGARPNVTVTDLDEKSAETKMLIVYIVVGIVVGLIVFIGIFCIVYQKCCKSKAKNNHSPKKKGKFDKYSAEAVPMETVLA